MSAATWEPGAPAAPGICAICRWPIEEHALEDARHCLELVVDNFCRLTGPKR